MDSFKAFIISDVELDAFVEQFDTLNIPDIFEEQTQSPQGKVSNNTKGVLHELLVGRHLNNGNHMELHPNDKKESPEQAHDRLKASIHPDDYREIDANAKSAAQHIKAHLAANGHDVSKVQWTSKPGDTEKVTGVKASQKEDSSDIYVSSTSKKGKTVHHGVSLKVGQSKLIPASSLGVGSSGPSASTILAQHRKSIVKSHPALATMTQASERKQWLKNNPKASADIKKKNLAALHKTAKGLADHLNSQQEAGNHQAVVDHLRTILHAHNTPAQSHGHGFIKHTTYSTAKGTQHHISNPGSDYESHFAEPHNISIEHRGTSVVFKNKRTGEKIATHSVKFESQSDPLSSLKGVGRPGL